MEARSADELTLREEAIVKTNEGVDMGMEVWMEGGERDGVAS